MKRISIQAKLPLIMVLLTLTAIITMGTISYITARAAILDEGGARLAAVGATKANTVEEFFHSIDRDLTVMAAHPTTLEALVALSEAFRQIEAPETTLQKLYIDENPYPAGEKDRLISAGSGSLYDVEHARYHPLFDRIQNTHDYYDVFLFDTQGNLVYSVFKELDYATNMVTGEWRDSGLAEVFRRAIAAKAGDPSVFEDFAAYSPSFGAPASFIAQPVFDSAGQTVGVLAYQMPIDAINTAVRDAAGLGQTGDAFLVGADGFLRTDAIETEEDDILRTELSNPVTSAALDGSSASGFYFDQHGHESLYAANPVTFLGTNWALIVKEDSEELHAPLAALWRAYILKGTILVAASLVLTLILSRGISRPLKAVSIAMDQVAQRRFDTAVPATDRGDEIGTIAVTLEEFRNSLAEAEAVAREAAFKSAGFEVSGAPMLMTDADLRIVYFNAALTRMIADRSDDFRKVVSNFDGGTLIGRELDIFPFPTGPMRARLSAGAKLPIKEKLRIGDAFIGLLVDAVQDKEGRHIGYVVEWRDQTYQMRSQVVLDAIDSSQCRAEIRLDGRLKSANKVFCDMLRSSEGSLVDAPGKTMIARDRAGDRDGSVWTEAGAGRTVFDVFSVRHNGVTRLVEGSLTPVPDEGSGISGFLMVGADVTEQRAVLVEAETRRTEMAAEQRRVVEALAQALRRLAKGDVTSRIMEPFGEDYEALRRDFNGAMDALGEALSTVVANAGQIRGGVAEISGAAEDLSKRTIAQAAALEETAAAIDELTASIKSAAQSAGDAARIATDARGKAEAGGEVVERAIAAMDGIASSSQQISSIVSVIDGIAFQTNLLALNAGVEAARAGDAGRGFAVVASEVRALAQRCSEAAAEIGALIGTASGQVSAGVDLVGETGSALRNIIRSVNDIATHVAEIAQSSAEQSSGLAEINSAMVQLDRSTQQNAGMVEETTAASQLLNTEAQGLMEAVSHFTVAASASGGQARSKRSRSSPSSRPRRSPRRTSSGCRPGA
jgi:methyl-accepting chemotaxis protein